MMIEDVIDREADLRGRGGLRVYGIEGAPQRSVRGKAHEFGDVDRATGVELALTTPIEKLHGAMIERSFNEPQFPRMDAPWPDNGTG
ncbi:hypothetical protein [Salinibacterium sp.]|uniref:hypothetical protein n=1 Tax=Salinibacterium sp. TaxID=1915057 RepID=UPI00286AFA4D|nr:hypothetical protein [Salinibacterium sp.]